MNQDLLLEVIVALQAKKGRWKQLAAEIPGVSYSLISQLGRGKYASNPSYKKLRTIIDHLRADRRAA